MTVVIILSIPGVSFPEGGMGGGGGGGGVGGGGGGGASRGFDISHSLSRHSLTVTM